MGTCWISVDERLPSREEEQDTSRIVLTIDGFGDMVSAWYQYERDPLRHNSPSQDKGYEIGWHGSSISTSDAPLENITHWMDINVLAKVPEAKCGQ